MNIKKLKRNLEHCIDGRGSTLSSYYEFEIKTKDGENRLYCYLRNSDFYCHITYNEDTHRYFVWIVSGRDNYKLGQTYTSVRAIAQLLENEVHRIPNKVLLGYWL